MIIRRVQTLKNGDISTFTWRCIAQFYNIEHTTRTLCNIHKISQKQIGNAKNQAEQIKYCLIQAKEYFDSAAHVSLATKPLLLYYSTMSLALAEILFKQSGDSRLSMLRANHNCHGLTLTTNGNPNPTESLNVSANKLIAKAQANSAGIPKGTFEVWRRSAREYPLGGYLKQCYENGNTTGYRPLFSPEDISPPMLPVNGITLYDCFKNLPYLSDNLIRWDSRLEMIRATATGEYNPANDKLTTTLTIHPAPFDLLDKFETLCELHPDYINHMQIATLPSGYILTWDNTKFLRLSLPHSTCITDRDVYFTCSKHNLSEFGYLYVSLHILGNFARYYPDHWMKHIDVNSPLASTADELCLNAMERLPLLLASELSRTYFVIER